ESLLRAPEPLLRAPESLLRAPEPLLRAPQPLWNLWKFCSRDFLSRLAERGKDTPATFINSTLSDDESLTWQDVTNLQDWSHLRTTNNFYRAA
ncbi:MAG: hypothetical protein KC415_20940, partial [Anaerolineales bacterium]|nr:hypothetical protein [Anaerolineales bacterium]